MYQEESSSPSRMDDMKERAGETAQQVKSQAGETVQQVKSQVGETAQQAKQEAKEASAKAQGYLSQQVDSRSTQAGQWMRKTGEDMRTTASTLRDKGDTIPAQINEQIGQRMENLGSYMEHTSGDQLMSDAQDFTRRNTWALAAGGLILGLVASRMIGASRARQQHQQTGYQRAHIQPSPYEQQMLDERMTSGVSGTARTSEDYSGPTAVPYPREDTESGARYGSG